MKKNITVQSTNGLKILKEGQTGFGVLLESDAGSIDKTHKYNEKALKSLLTDPTEFFKNPYIYCVLQRYDVPNKNRRIYPKNNLLSAVEKYMELVKMRTALGEVDHSDSTSVSLNNVGLHIEDIDWQGNTAMGKVLLPVTRGFKEMGICSSPADTIVNLIMYNILTGISSRAIGTVEKSGKYDAVQNDLQILCWDFVTTPSTPNAYNRLDRESAMADVAYEGDKPIIQAAKKSVNHNERLANFLGRFR